MMQHITAPIPSISHRLVAVSEALRFWREWTADVSPCGSTGFADVDRALADAFRALLKLPDNDARLAWLERAVFTTDDFPSPARPCSPYREELILWWLEVFNEIGR